MQELVSGTPSVNFLTGLGIDEFLTRTDGSGTSTYLTDALGSTVALADTSAAACSDYRAPIRQSPSARSTKAHEPRECAPRERSGARGPRE